MPPFEFSNFLPERRCLVGKPQEIADELQRYADAGVSLVVFDLTMLPDEVLRTMEWVAVEVRPLLG